MSKLTFEYEGADDDGFGWLSVAVETPLFKGTGGFWVQWQDLADLALALTRYPITTEQPVEARWGFQNEPTMVALRIVPANARGGLEVLADVTDYGDKRLHCGATFETNYPDLDRFRVELEAMLKGSADAAVLAG